MTSVEFRSSLFWDITQRRLVVTDVSVQPIGPIFMDRADWTVLPLKICLTVEDGSDRLSRNVDKYQSTVRNIAEERIPYILESNPHPFYSFRGLKNQMRIRIACGLDSRS